MDEELDVELVEGKVEEGDMAAHGVAHDDPTDVHISASAAEGSLLNRSCGGGRGGGVGGALHGGLFAAPLQAHVQATLAVPLQSTIGRAEGKRLQQKRNCSARAEAGSVLERRRLTDEPAYEDGSVSSDGMSEVGDGAPPKKEPAIHALLARLPPRSGWQFLDHSQYVPGSHGLKGDSMD
jgi:hypothetical protein